MTNVYFRKCWLHFAIVMVYGMSGRHIIRSGIWLCHAFSSPGGSLLGSKVTPKLKVKPCRVVCDEDGIDIPPFHVDDEKIKEQVLRCGPDIPSEAWDSPQRPPGFFGHKGMASDFRFCKPDKPVMSRMMRRKYKQVIYKHVRAKYKTYIKDARSVAELMYWQAKLDSLPRDSSKTRYNRICMVTGRTRAVYRIVGLTRHQFREYAYQGFIPGIKRANW